MLNSDRSTVKHALQNTQNDCHQWLSHGVRVHQIRFWPGLRPGPRWGSLQRSPDPLAGLRGPTSKGKGRVGEGKERTGREADGPLTQIPGSAPAAHTATLDALHTVTAKYSTKHVIIYRHMALSM